MARSIKWLDSFDRYSATADMLAVYGSSTISSTGGRFGGRCNSSNAGGTSPGAHITVPFGGTFGATSDWLYVSWAVKFSGLGSATPATSAAFMVGGGGTTVADVVAVRLNAAGKLEAYRGATLLATGTLTVAINTYYRLEVGLFMHATNGRFKVMVDGVADIDFTGNTVPTNAAGFTNCYYGGAASAVYQWIDDLMVYTDAPNTFAGDFVGRFDLPVAAGVTNQGTPNTGTSVAAVDDPIGVHDGDTTYVSHASIGMVDLFTLPDVPATATILGVQVGVQARTDGPGARQIKPTLRNSGVNQQGAAQVVPVQSTYATLVERFAVDKDGVAFTPTTYNGAQVGWETAA